MQLVLCTLSTPGANVMHIIYAYIFYIFRNTLKHVACHLIVVCPTKRGRGRQKENVIAAATATPIGRR